MISYNICILITGNQIARVREAKLSGILKNLHSHSLFLNISISSDKNWPMGDVCSLNFFDWFKRPINFFVIWIIMNTGRNEVTGTTRVIEQKLQIIANNWKKKIVSNVFVYVNYLRCTLLNTVVFARIIISGIFVLM